MICPKLFFLCLTALLIHTVEAQYDTLKPGKQTSHYFEMSDGNKIGFLLYLPQNYSADNEEKYPLLMFLHGGGERGSQLDSVKRHGPPMILEKGGDMPFIVVSPQCPDTAHWETECLEKLRRHIVESLKVDSDRMYLTGLSMGGYGTWAYAMEYPELFAAIVPICGGGEKDKVCVLRDVPVWAFHGAKDKTVLPEKAQEMVDALKACGGNVNFKVYPEAGHDSWTETYNNPELYSWLQEQKRGNSGIIVKKQPDPKGGMSGFYRFLSRKLKYPKEARKAGIKGKVFVQFLIDEEGNIVKVKTIRGLHPLLDKEAERIIIKSSPWNPGIDNYGNPVKVVMILPIIFKL